MDLSILCLSLTNLQYFCNNYFVIKQYPSYDKHICAMLFIISYDKL